MSNGPSRPTRILRGLGERLGALPSIGIGLGYLILIPIFAGIYWPFQDEFLYSTARYEPLPIAQAKAVAERLRDTFLADAVRAQYSGPSLYGRPVQKSKDGVFPFFTIEPEGDHVRIVAWLLRHPADSLHSLFVKVALDLDESATLTMGAQGDQKKVLSALMQVF